MTLPNPLDRETAEAWANWRAYWSDNSPPSLRALLEYEVKSSWWAGWLPSEAMQDAAATYYAWKVKRKYARFQASTKKPTADQRS